MKQSEFFALAMLALFVLGMIILAPLVKRMLEMIGDIFSLVWAKLGAIYWTAGYDEMLADYPVVLQKFPYYTLLNEEEKKEFIHRLQYVIANKSFVGRGLEMTNEIQIMIGASLVQLTFGLEKFDLPNLEQIHVTPESFYSRLVEHQVKGLTIGRGRVILSWQDFLEGYEITNDKLNLGLHELAHALWGDHFSDFEVAAEFEEWENTAMHELQSERLGNKSDFLREYACTNIEEFWACCVECFFEAPLEFKNKIPVLYEKVKQVLNQDMAERVLATSELNTKAPIPNLINQ